MRFVPIVAVVPEWVADMLPDLAVERRAGLSDPAAERALQDMQKRNGWTTEMLVAGLTLAAALKQYREEET